MRRLFGTVIGLAVIVLVVLAPSALYSVADDAGATYEPTSITRYLADFEIADDGSMQVTETITVDFPFGDRHGIFRFWDVDDPNAPSLRREPQDVSVTLDGRSEPFEMLTEDRGRYRVAKIGSADVTIVPGNHTYVIEYRIDDALVESDVHSSQLYWNLVPGGWAQPIADARLTVTLPDQAQDVSCAVGAGTEAGCVARGEGTNRLVVKVEDLAPRTPVTVQTGLDLPVPEVRGTSRPWSPRFDQVLGSPWALAAVLLLALGALAWGSVIGARSREPKPGYPLQYAPPDGVGPAQGQYILTEAVGREAFVASVLQSAERGAVDLERDGEAWTIRDKGGAAAWGTLDPVTSQVARLLHGPGTEFTADPDDVQAGKRLKARLSEFESSTKEWARSGGLMVSSGLGSLGALVVLAALGATLALVIWNPLDMSAIALVPGWFAVGGASLLRTGSGTRRTAAGRDLWSRVGGFHRVLSTPSSEQRFDFSGREELYTAYVPWAVAFGCADEWASKYRTEMGHEPPEPDYFAGAYVGSSVRSSVDGMVDSFSGTLDSAISSYEATQKSSSSSGGGGFSGGGGGGGGGGGSW